MKKVVTILISSVLFYSCQKSDLSELKNQFPGNWEYVNFIGYPFNENYQPPGNGKIIYFSKGGSFERRSHDTVLFKGSYTLYQKKDCNSNEKKIFLITSDPSFVQNFSISISGDSLFISSPSCFNDGGTSIYRKL